MGGSRLRVLYGRAQCLGCAVAAAAAAQLEPGRPHLEVKRGRLHLCVGVTIRLVYLFAERLLIAPLSLSWIQMCSVCQFCCMETEPTGEGKTHTGELRVEHQSSAAAYYWISPDAPRRPMQSSVSVLARSIIRQVNSQPTGRRSWSGQIRASLQRASARAQQRPPKVTWLQMLTQVSTLAWDINAPTSC